MHGPISWVADLWKIVSCIQCFPYFLYGFLLFKHGAADWWSAPVTLSQILAVFMCLFWHCVNTPVDSRDGKTRLIKAADWQLQPPMSSRNSYSGFWVELSHTAMEFGISYCSSILLFVQYFICCHAFKAGFTSLNAGPGVILFLILKYINVWMKRMGFSFTWLYISLFPFCNCHIRLL